MLAIDDEKLPPPKPVRQATRSSVSKETPGFSTKPVTAQGIISNAALMTVQFRPPSLATANVYGIRMAEPTAAGAVVSRNFWPGLKPYFFPRNSTKTDHRVQIDDPMCSEE